MNSSKKNPKKSEEFFNPVKEEKKGERARRVVWTSQSLQLAIEALGQGKKLVANPFLDNNVRLLKADLVYQRTEEEKKEWVKCKNDIIYFAENYCPMLTPEGYKKVVLREYQKGYLRHLASNQLSICLQCRQSGKTTTTSLFMIHYLLFHVDKNALICSNIRKNAVEVIDKVKNIYMGIPFFLKAGIHKWNESEIVMDNGCRVQATATTINSGIGNTIHMLILDEFAHVAPNIIDKFYNNVFPTVSASKAKVAIISTQNGRNLFYRLYKAAEKGENDYKPYKVEWKDVPEWNPEKRCWEPRDRAWYERQVANYGSVEAFESQMGTNFDLASRTLISDNYLKSLDLVRFETRSMPKVPLESSWKWHPQADPGTLNREWILVTIDLAEGTGNDFTVFEIYRLIEGGKLELIGYFRNNQASRSEYVSSLRSVISQYFHPDRYLLSFERNTYGDIFWEEMKKQAEEADSLEWSGGTVIRYKGTPGIKITPANKTPHCLLFKEAFEKGDILARDEEYIYELQNFTDHGNGRYRASFGHDDLIMSSIQVTFATSTPEYSHWLEDWEMSHENPDPGGSQDFWNPYKTLGDPMDGDWDYPARQVPVDAYSTTFYQS